MEKDVQQDFLLQKELRKIFKEGWVKEEKVRKILELAKISLPNLNEKQKFSIDKMKKQILFYLAEKGKICSYQEEQKEVVILVNKGFSYENFMIELKWKNDIGNHNLKYTIDKLQNDIYYNVNQKGVNLSIYGEEKFSDTEIQVHYENPIKEERITVELWGDRKKKKELLDLCFCEIVKELPRIMTKQNEAREAFEEAVCKIRKETGETKPFSSIKIEQSKNKEKNYVIEEIIYETVKTKKVKEKLGENSYIWIKYTENEKNNTEKWEITYSENYYLEIEESLVHFKVQKQPNNSKLILQIRNLYTKTKVGVNYFAEDNEKIEISLEKRKLSFELKKMVNEIEEKGIKIYNSKNIKL